jgi:hypothetical protein
VRERERESQKGKRFFTGRRREKASFVFFFLFLSFIFDILSGLTVNRREKLPYVLQTEFFLFYFFALPLDMTLAGPARTGLLFVRSRGL